MKPDSQILLHVGIDFITHPAITISNQTQLQLLQAVNNAGLDYHVTEVLGDRIIVRRNAPSPLEIAVINPSPQLSQFLVIAPEPKSSFDLFIDEAEAAIHAITTVWSSPNRQIVQADATIRQLHETTSNHAFQELWESRLGQSSQALTAFGHPIRGGGLRFVMQPQSAQDLLAEIEVKIESFLMDSSKIFVETQFKWISKPAIQITSFSVREYLEEMNQYIRTNVEQFMSGAIGEI